MFDRSVDGYMTGAFRIEISSHKNEDGSYTSTWVGPNGDEVQASDSSQSEAHRQCEAKVREAVLKREISLGR